jgi:hypothetical protein
LRVTGVGEAVASLEENPQQYPRCLWIQRRRFAGQDQANRLRLAHLAPFCLALA